MVLCGRVNDAFVAGVSMSASRARWCGVRAGSWRLMILVPTRSREINFCWVQSRFVNYQSRSQSRLRILVSAGVP